MNSGSFHEPANLAGLWGKQGLCPIVYIVENNQYAMGTPVDRSSAVTNLASRFSMYAIENERADGMDFIEVRRLAGRAVRRARATRPRRAGAALTFPCSGRWAARVVQA